VQVWGVRCGAWSGLSFNHIHLSKFLFNVDLFFVFFFGSWMFLFAFGISFCFWKLNTFLFFGCKVFLIIFSLQKIKILFFYCIFFTFISLLVCFALNIGHSLWLIFTTLTTFHRGRISIIWLFSSTFNKIVLWN
jgi:hypothetical protein